MTETIINMIATKNTCHINDMYKECAERYIEEEILWDVLEWAEEAHLLVITTEGYIVLL